MKKTIAAAVALALCAILLYSCGPAQSGSGPANSKAPPKAGTALRVVTSFGADDGYRQNYVQACEAWEAATGGIVLDNSATSDEKWKAQVLADFETGSDPDVLFYFTGADANPIIGLDKVVSIEEIRKEYPGFASNMVLARIPASPLDNKRYAVPTTGFWEGLYVNKEVLAQAGVEVPGPDTTWEEFEQACEAVLRAGYTPIAVSLATVPHYWFEFCILNNGGVHSHVKIPESEASNSYQSWVQGLYDIKDLYNKGYFPQNTLTATDDETFQLLAEGKAAFAIDGSWKLAWFEQNGYDPASFTVTYVPAKEARRPTDIIGGLSMGYYITRKAWDNPQTRSAAVSFVQVMTSDEVVQGMSMGLMPTALARSFPPPDGLPPLQQGALEMAGNYTRMVPPVQDMLSVEARNKIMAEGVKQVVAGQISPEQAVEQIMHSVG